MPLVLQALVIGIVQGLTEFLPISSSAHLIVVPQVLGWNDPFLNSASFDVMLHAGTLVALLVFFRRELVDLLAAWLASLRDRRIGTDPDRRLAWLIVVTMLPGALLGVGFESFFDTFFRQHIILVALFLTVGAGILWLAEQLAFLQRGLDNVNLRDAVVIGSAQALALFPGFSRSGMTIAAGLYTGLTREAAARFSFLMATPIIAGAAAWKARELLHATPSSTDIVALGAGLLGATVAGLLAIAFLLGYLRRHTTSPFVAERLVLAALVVVFVLSR
ncbi:MAG TPA: undecaprenyl-diphosphatase UppP [Candidatus Acidoferrales bacterium]|nr:undecaprenyl-diphosphatase UppP [Candidatus Acidoferrales bacterium]